MNAEPNAQLIAGFAKDTSQAEYQQYLDRGAIEDLLREINQEVELGSFSMRQQEIKSMPWPSS